MTIIFFSNSPNGTILGDEISLYNPQEAQEKALLPLGRVLDFVSSTEKNPLAILLAFHF
jgi:hypothetical protein